VAVRFEGGVMSTRKQIFFVIALATVVILCFASAAHAQSITFYQLDYDVNGTVTGNTDWGRADLTFTGTGRIQYFNLNVNGTWQAQNVAVPSVEGVGVDQTVSIWFSLGNPVGVDVAALSYDYTLTDLPAFMPFGSNPAPVFAQDYVVVDGVTASAPGAPGDLTPAVPKTGGMAADGQGGQARGNVPNQESVPKGCTPTAFSNSLKWLNDTYNLKMAAADVSTSALAAVIIDPATGLPWPNFENLKDQYLKGKGYPVSTTTFAPDAIGQVGDLFRSGQDVEMWVASWTWDAVNGKWVQQYSHMVTVVGMVPLEDGTTEIWWQDDSDQSKEGGLRRTSSKYDPTKPPVFRPGTGSFTDGDFNGGEIVEFIVECPTGVPAPSRTTKAVSPEGAAPCRTCHPPGDGSNPWVEFPPGAVASDTFMYFGTFPDPNIPAPTSVPGGVGRVVDAYEFGPDGRSFGVPLTITMRYDPAELGGMDEAGLKAVVYDPVALTWSEVPGAVLNTASHTMELQTGHFSVYGIAGFYAGPVTTVPASAPWGLATLAVTGVFGLWFFARHRSRPRSGSVISRN
jgi:hypothetical protein